MSVMAPSARNRESVINGDLVFAVLLITNSLRKMYVFFMEKGVWNPKTGKPYTQMGLYGCIKKSAKFLEFRYRRDVTHEYEDEVARPDELEWAKECVKVELPKVLEHIKNLKLRQEANSTIDAL
jgi:hypothetical protein